jgi:hypothetical protein
MRREKIPFQLRSPFNNLKLWKMWMKWKKQRMKSQVPSKLQEMLNRKAWHKLLRLKTARNLRNR